MSRSTNNAKLAKLEERRAIFPGPLPRLRIYSTVGQYWKVLLELLTARSHHGNSVEELEQTIAKRVDVKYATAMPMARVGIYFAVKALIKPGQKVILSPYTISDVVNMVVCAGGVPLFADIERETCNIDAAEVDRLINNETGAVMVTHFYGLACDIERIAQICRTHGVPLIEDAAQAFGVRVNGRAVGTFGAAGIYSAGMYKNVNSFLGGIVVTNSEALKQKIDREIKALPYQPLVGYLKRVMQALAAELITFPPLFRIGFFWIFRYAALHDLKIINNRLKIDLSPDLKKEIPKSYLCRMLPLQARLILGQLDGVERDMTRRIEAARLYQKGLCDLGKLILPPLRTDGSHMYWYFSIQFADRHDLVAYAMRKGRDITESYHRNCADMSCFSAWYRDCPRARSTASSLIYLPTYPRYTNEEIAKTVQVIRSYFGL
jgi:dTDP-4-amino-4,6-dideoxygalactose transaminase